MKSIEKIDIYKIRGEWKDNYNGYISGGDDTILSIVMVAEKLNEVIEKFNQSNIKK